MTRLLSELLNAQEPSFRLGLNRLELANGRPNHDIRLTSELVSSTKAKIQELGLDPQDTTGEELYRTLQERVKADDKRLERALRARAASYVSAESDLTSGMVHALQYVPQTKQCFALKATVAKALLKRQPPKRALKRLGYRSLDSMLRHEVVPQVMAAAYLSESPAWQRAFTEQYKSLQASDFELRDISITSPATSRWLPLMREALESQHQTVISLRELGSIIILPLPEDRPEATVVATLALAVHELNEIQATSTFLRLAQVQADFGARVMALAKAEPHLQAKLLDQPVPWHMLQRFYTRLSQAVPEQIFEPYLQLDDFSWHSVEQVLSQIAPSLAFWQQTAHLGLLDKGRAVSLNIMDNALSCCNRLSYAERRVATSQQALMAELSLRYLNHDKLSAAILNELQPQLAVEEAII